jgi:hypothetical protein
MPPSSGWKFRRQLEKNFNKNTLMHAWFYNILQYSTLKMQHISTELSSPPTKLHGVIFQKIATSSLINYLLTKRSTKLQGEMSSTSA